MGADDSVKIHKSSLGKIGEIIRIMVSASVDCTGLLSRAGRELNPLHQLGWNITLIFLMGLGTSLNKGHTCFPYPLFISLNLKYRHFSFLLLYFEIGTKPTRFVITVALELKA